MAERLTNPELTEQEQRELDAKREQNRNGQPYSSELADRELEHAHKEKRPTQTNDESAPETPERDPS